MTGDWKENIVKAVVMHDQGSIFDRLVEIGRSDEEIAETYVEEGTVEMLVALARVRGAHLAGRIAVRDEDVRRAQATISRLIEKTNSVRETVVQMSQHKITPVSGMSAGWARQLDENLYRLEGAWEVLSALGFRMNSAGEISRHG